MAGSGFPSPSRVRLTDLVPADGLPTENYKNAVAMLSQSLTRYNTAVIEILPGDDVVLKCVLDSSRMFFNQRPIIGPESVRPEELQDWSRTVGYYSEFQYGREMYDYRPGRMLEESSELPPAGLPELFSALGRAARYILEAICCSLELRSFSFADMLDNMPLKHGEVSSSILSVYCHGRTRVHQPPMGLPGQEHAQLPVFEPNEPQADRGFLTLVRSDRQGLQIRDSQGRWFLADCDLGPQDMVLHLGHSLYQVTAGYFSPSFYRTEIGSASSSSHNAYGRCSVAFKFMPKASGYLHCQAMSAAGRTVNIQFQQTVSVQEFMQRTHSIDQFLSGRPGLLPLPEGPQKPKRRKQISRNKPLAPSKRFRLEAQRVLKERVQEIADSKGLKIRFCNFKECEENHLTASDSPCAAMRAELGWPSGVPFVHPHDLPNKAKLAFLEAYEPGWSASQDGAEVGIVESAQHPHSRHLTGAPPVEDVRFAVKTVYEYLRGKGKPVPTGKPQVVGHKVDLSGLAKASYDAGGRAQFEAAGGFQRFITENFHLENASDKEKERALERLKKLYDQVLNDYVEDLLASSQLD